MKFNIGDKVEIIKYGHLCWEGVNCSNPMQGSIIYEQDGLRAVDMNPDMIGTIGIISGIGTGNTYSIETKDDSIAWLDKRQLSLINANPNVL